MEIREIFKITESVLGFISLNDQYKSMSKSTQELGLTGLKSVQEMLFFHSKNWKKLMANLEKIIKIYPPRYFFFPKAIFKNINTKNLAYHMSFIARDTKTLEQST